MIKSWDDILTEDQAQDLIEETVLELQIFLKACIEKEVCRMIVLSYYDGRRLCFYSRREVFQVFGINELCLVVEDFSRVGVKPITRIDHTNYESLYRIVETFELTPKFLIDLRRKVHAKVSDHD